MTEEKPRPEKKKKPRIRVYKRDLAALNAILRDQNSTIGDRVAGVEAWVNYKAGGVNG